MRDAKQEVILLFSLTAAGEVRGGKRDGGFT